MGTLLFLFTGGWREGVDDERRGGGAPVRARGREEGGERNAPAARPRRAVFPTEAALTALAPSSSAGHSRRGRMCRRKSGSYSAGKRATLTASILKG